MRKKMAIAAVIFALLVVQAQTVFAADPSWEFNEAIKANNFNKAERIIKNNIKKMSESDKSMTLHYALCEVYGDKSLQALKILSQYGITPSSYDLWNAFDESQSNSVIDFIMPYVKEIGANTIRKAIELRKYNYLPKLISMCNDLNIRSSKTDKYYADNPNRWKSEYSKTALIKASEMEHLPSVKLLVEAGANVNIRAEDGSTAASIAYDKGNIDIYDYLVAHGAREFTPLQIPVQQQAPAQQAAAPSSQTNVYVQSTPEQSAPAQRPAPSAPTLNTGTFSWSNSGQNMTMVIRAGMVTFNVNGRMAWTGAYTISGRQIVLSVYNTADNYKNLRGMTFSYNIDSDTSFSGSGETWVRTGL
jgi:hypothetical protein